MVVIHFKKTKGNEFLYETNTQILNDDLYIQLCEGKFLIFKLFILNTNQFLISIVNNLRLKLDRLAQSVEELAAKGPLKPEELRGLEPSGFAEYLKAGDITVTTGLEKMEK